MRGGEGIGLAGPVLIAVSLVVSSPQPAWGSPCGLSGANLSVSRPDSASTEGTTELRGRLLERQRRTKMAVLRPPEQNVMERGLLFFENSKLVDRLRYGYHGFFLKFGGLTTESGFALGLRYQNDKLIKNSSVYSSFRLSVQKYQHYEAGFKSKPSRSIPLRFGLNARYRNYPQEEYFGLGPDSSKRDETSYRLEDIETTLWVAASPLHGVELGVKGGYLRGRTGAGADDTPLDEVFEPASVAGFGESIEFITVGVTASLDYRDSRGNPRSGIALFLDHTKGEDRDGDAYSFLTSSAEFQGYLPFLHKHRVIALRALAWEAKGSEGGVVPFNHLPYVGGGYSIRGFEEYRFRDAKLLLGNVEYRFEAFIGLDVALFGDFGQVGGEWSDFRTSEFKYSYGGGLRFNTAYSVFMRLDLGYGKEGTRFFWKFENVF